VSSDSGPGALFAGDVGSDRAGIPAIPVFAAMEHTKYGFAARMMSKTILNTYLEINICQQNNLEDKMSWTSSEYPSIEKPTKNPYLIKFIVH